MATAQQQRRPRGGRSAARKRQDNHGIIPVLAKAVRDVENQVRKGQLSLGLRSRYQAIALLARAERARVRDNADLTDSQRDTELKRLQGIATILAQTSALEPSLFSLLDEDAEVSDTTRRLKREMQIAGGLEPDPEPQRREEDDDPTSERRVTPRSVRSAQLSNPFMVPDFSAPPPRVHGRLAGWDLIGPLLSSFENAAAGAPACMALPEPRQLRLPASLELMPHQSKVISSVADGHRTFLLADEPGLGKTAQALLAAEASGSFPLLAIVPNVVKTNWAREAQQWIPNRTVTVIHGDGETMDGFADVVVVNYEILDRHVDWMGRHGFRGMVVDEAHYIKNKKSHRSQHVLEISRRVRRRIARPLMMALTGTPLVNDIEDFRAIWEFLGWIDDRKPEPVLMAALEATGMTPMDHAFYPVARQSVIDLGVVRRRKIDVAADIPDRRIADIPVELEGAVGRSIREAERKLAQRLVERYRAALATRRTHEEVEGIDHDLVHRVATWEVSDGRDADTSGEDNVFTMVRRIGQAKAELAADYAAQLARSAGKVVFFAKHLDVMNTAGELFTKRGLQYTEVRGDQTSSVRQQAIDGFVNDPEVSVIICSLTAAGVGLNLQVSSNVVLSELSWTNAEQTQAIDRVHRIGQTEPVTAWRIVAAQTIDTKIAELIDAKAGLAARALDGAGEAASSSADVQVDALAALLTDQLERLEAAGEL